VSAPIAEVVLEQVQSKESEPSTVASEGLETRAEAVDTIPNPVPRVAKKIKKAAATPPLDIGTEPTDSVEAPTQESGTEDLQIAEKETPVPVEDAVQIVKKPARAPQAPSSRRKPPPVGSIAFLEHVKKSMHCPKNFECCKDRFIDLCKAKISSDGKEVLCHEGKNCGCRFQKKSFFKRICTCDMRQHILREYGY